MELSQTTGQVMVPLDAYNALSGGALELLKEKDDRIAALTAEVERLKAGIADIDHWWSKTDGDGTWVRWVHGKCQEVLKGESDA